MSHNAQQCGQVTNTLTSEPRLPPELVDLILAALGDSSDRASRSALLACSLVSKSFHIYAQQYYFRKLTIKYFVDQMNSNGIPEREYQLIRFFFDNPHLLAFVQELVVIYDAAHHDKARLYPELASPVSQESIHDQFPWTNPPPESTMEKTPALFLLLRHSPVHTARFAVINLIPNTARLVTHQHLAPICSIPTLKRLYLVKLMLASIIPMDEHPKLVPGLERLEILWIASSEEEFNEPIPALSSSAQPTLESPSATPTSAHHSVFPPRQIIRMNRLHGLSCIWLRPRALFQLWFPDYKPSPSLARLMEVPWQPRLILDYVEVRDALDDVHNTCPSVRRVRWDNSWTEDRPFIEIIIERNHDVEHSRLWM